MHEQQSTTATPTRVAVVTGAGQGIGRAIARSLAAAGTTVAVTDRSEEHARAVVQEITEAGGTAEAFLLDVTSADSVARATEDVTARWGSIGILVNNAGWDELRPFVETDEAFWDRVIDINLRGCLRVTRAVLPGMLEHGWGRVVNIGSDAGRVGSSNEAVYSATKGGIIAFSKTLAREVARAGVTVNAVCPGPTATPLLEGMAAEGGDRLVRALERAIPVGRLGQPEDVAAAVTYLAGETAGFVTGQTLSVSGGLTMA